MNDIVDRINTGDDEQKMKQNDRNSETQNTLTARNESEPQLVSSSVAHAVTFKITERK